MCVRGQIWGVREGSVRRGATPMVWCALTWAVREESVRDGYARKAPRCPCASGVVCAAVALQTTLRVRWAQTRSL